MTTDLLISARLASGQRLSISQGLRVCTHAEPGVLDVYSQEWGNASWPLPQPDIGPRDTRWARDGRWQKSTRSRSEAVAEFWKPGGSIPLGQLTTTEVWWVESALPTHVLMDPESRVLKGVRPLHDDLKGAFWGTLKDVFSETPQKRRGYFEPPNFAEDEDVLPSWGHPQAGLWAGLNPLWFCLGPSLVGDPAWVFEGQQHVRILRTDEETWDIALLGAVDEEQNNFGLVW